MKIIKSMLAQSQYSAFFSICSQLLTVHCLFKVVDCCTLKAAVACRLCSGPVAEPLPAAVGGANGGRSLLFGCAGAPLQYCGPWYAACTCTYVCTYMYCTYVHLCTYIVCTVEPLQKSTVL